MQEICLGNPRTVLVKVMLVRVERVLELLSPYPVQFEKRLIILTGAMLIVLSLSYFLPARKVGFENIATTRGKSLFDSRHCVTTPNESQSLNHYLKFVYLVVDSTIHLRVTVITTVRLVVGKT